jgi:hypothetical protein
MSMYVDSLIILTADGNKLIDGIWSRADTVSQVTNNFSVYQTWTSIIFMNRI